MSLTLGEQVSKQKVDLLTSRRKRRAEMLTRCCWSPTSPGRQVLRPRGGAGELDQPLRVQNAAGGHAAQNDGPRIGACDEEDPDEEDHRDRREQKERVLLEVREQPQRLAGPGGRADRPVGLVIGLDARSPEYGEPDHGEDSRGDHHPQDKLPDRASPGDASNEYAHVRAQAIHVAQKKIV
jgi:hypothetical protein